MGDDKKQLLQSLAIDRSAPPPPKRPWLPLTLGILLGAAATAGGFWFTASDSGTPAKPAETAAATTAAPPPRAAPADAPPADAKPAKSGLAASGYVVARRKATVAAEITGKVTDVFIEEGVVVTAGQPLARLDCILAERDLALARSRVASADAAAASVAADLEDAERVLNRTETLSRQDFASHADLTKAAARAALLRANLRKSQAEAETARLDVRRNEEQLEKYLIRAPFAGVVVDKSVQPGEMISPLSAGGGFTRTGIGTIVDMDSLEIEVDVNEAFIGRVRPGEHVDAILDAYPDWTIPGSVIAIIPTANREKATVKVRIAFQQKDPRILPDMAVKVTFIDNEHSAAAPTAAAAD